MPAALFFSCGVVAELIELRLVARDAAVFEDARPAAYCHFVLRDERPYLQRALPGSRVQQRVGQRHLHAEPVRTRTLPALFQHGLLADRVAVLIQPLALIETR